MHISHIYIYIYIYIHRETYFVVILCTHNSGKSETVGNTMFQQNTIALVRMAHNQPRLPVVVEGWLALQGLPRLDADPLTK